MGYVFVHKPQAGFMPNVQLLGLAFTIWILLSPNHTWCETPALLGARVKVYFWSGSPKTGEVKSWAADTITLQIEASRVKIPLAGIMEYEILASRPDSTGGSRKASLENESWRKKLNNARMEKTVLLAAGTATVLAGTGLYIVGKVLNFNSSFGEGCNYTGTQEVLCDSETSRSRAQAEIDKSEVEMLTGLTGMILGSLVMIGAQTILGEKIRTLGTEGKANGFAVSLSPEPQRIALVITHTVQF